MVFLKRVLMGLPLTLMYLLSLELVDVPPHGVSRMPLLHKLPGPFHLKLILNAVITAHSQCLKNGDAAGASAMERLFQKVGLELYARKLMKSAALAPKCLDRGECLRLQSAAADNYQNSGGLQGVEQRDEDQPQLR
jgi:hypothetical protein